MIFCFQSTFQFVKETCTINQLIGFQARKVVSQCFEMTRRRCTICWEKKKGPRRFQCNHFSCSACLTLRAASSHTRGRGQCSLCLSPEVKLNEVKCHVASEKHSPTILSSEGYLLKHTKSCPRCGIHIEKISGCSWVDCRCGCYLNYSTGCCQTCGLLHCNCWVGGCLYQRFQRFPFWLVLTLLTFVAMLAGSLYMSET